MVSYLKTSSTDWTIIDSTVLHDYQKSFRGNLSAFNSREKLATMATITHTSNIHWIRAEWAQASHRPWPCCDCCIFAHGDDRSRVFLLSTLCLLCQNVSCHCSILHRGGIYRTHTTTPDLTFYSSSKKIPENRRVNPLFAASHKSLFLKRLVSWNIISVNCLAVLFQTLFIRACECFPPFTGFSEKNSQDCQDLWGSIKPVHDLWSETIESSH